MPMNATNGSAMSDRCAIDAYPIPASGDYNTGKTAKSISLEMSSNGMDSIMMRKRKVTRIFARVSILSSACETPDCRSVLLSSYMAYSSLLMALSFVLAVS